ncbi:MAG: CIA30 family protein [Verrucomicrobiota bacterium]
MKQLVLLSSLVLVTDGFGGSPDADEESEILSLTEFVSHENDSLDWRVVNDGVMGGLSQGELRFSESETLLFRGVLSLENQGGFSMVETGPVVLNLEAAEGILLRVRGDGRSYQMRLASDARFRGNEVAFQGEFQTADGVWTEVKVPFERFQGTYRGRSLPEAKLNPAAIQRFAILLGDKTPGPFALEVDFIRAY